LIDVFPRLKPLKLFLALFTLSGRQSFHGFALTKVVLLQPRLDHCHTYLNPLVFSQSHHFMPFKVRPLHRCSYRRIGRVLLQHTQKCFI
jgi:hypothetical protein